MEPPSIFNKPEPDCIVKPLFSKHKVALPLKEGLDGLNVKIEELTIEADTEMEVVNKHLQSLYDNQRNFMEKLAQIKRDYDYDMKLMRDEIDYLVMEDTKVKRRNKGLI